MPQGSRFNLQLWNRDWSEIWNLGDCESSSPFKTVKKECKFFEAEAEIKNIKIKINLQIEFPLEFLILWHWQWYELSYWTRGMLKLKKTISISFKTRKGFLNSRQSIIFAISLRKDFLCMHMHSCKIQIFM